MYFMWRSMNVTKATTLNACLQNKWKLAFTKQSPAWCRPCWFGKWGSTVSSFPYVFSASHLLSVFFTSHNPIPICWLCLLPSLVLSIRTILSFDPTLFSLLLLDILAGNSQNRVNCSFKERKKERTSDHCRDDRLNHRADGISAVLLSILTDILDSSVVSTIWRRRYHFQLNYTSL
jgi:hypothetical protein